MLGLGSGDGHGMVARVDVVSVPLLLSRLGLSCLIVYYSLVLEDVTHDQPCVFGTQLIVDIP